MRYMIVMIARIGKIWNELKNVLESYKIPRCKYQINNEEVNNYDVKLVDHTLNFKVAFL